MTMAEGKRRAAIAVVAAMVPSTASAEMSTAYSPCSAGSIMADGSHVRPGSLAHNGYPLGTRVWVTPAVFGRHRWTVRDRIGWGSQADFWTPSCGAADAYGRRYVKIRRGWLHRVGRVYFKSSGIPAS